MKMKLYAAAVKAMKRLDAITEELILDGDVDRHFPEDVRKVAAELSFALRAMEPAPAAPTIAQAAERAAIYLGRVTEQNIIDESDVDDMRAHRDELFSALAAEASKLEAITAAAKKILSEATPDTDDETGQDYGRMTVSSDAIELLRAALKQ